MYVNQEMEFWLATRTEEGNIWATFNALKKLKPKSKLRRSV